MSRWSKFGWALLGCTVLLSLSAVFTGRPARAGGPMAVGGPNLGTAGQPILWDLASLPNHAIPYRVDGGPLSTTPDGTVVIDNTAGLSRVQGMFQTWQNVSTSSVAFTYAGPILAVGAFAGGDVKTVADFDAVFGSCNDGTQSPVIFDADGSLVMQLIGDPNVIGFAAICDVDQSGHAVAAGALLSGAMQDGIYTSMTWPPNYELTTNAFNQAIAHEFGHFSGLDHSQINVDVLFGSTSPCSTDVVAGLPLMFPILFCPDRMSYGLPALAPDDLAWISRLYPVTTAAAGKTLTSSAYGTIQGNILFADGVSGAQGVNVIARQVDNPTTPQNESLRVAVSVVSGFLFTGNPGQNLSCPIPDATNPRCNNNGSVFGSRDPALAGHFEIPVPPGTYTVEVESVFYAFTGGSSVGPLDPPIPMPGTAQRAGPVTVAAGGSVSLNITLQGTRPRFDSYESAWHFERKPLEIWKGRKLPARFAARA